MRLWAERVNLGFRFECPKPGSLHHRALSCVVSACELFLAVDQLGAFAITGAETAEEIDLFRDDLAAIAINASCIGPLGVVDAAVGEDRCALFAVLCNGISKTVEEIDEVRFE